MENCIMVVNNDLKMKNLNKYIDYTLLKYATSKQVKQFVKEANEKKYFGVCVQPSYIEVVKKYLNPELKIITIAGFPPQYTWDFIAKHPRGSLSLGLYRKEIMWDLHDAINNPNVDELDMIFPFMWYSAGKKLKITKFLTGIEKRFGKPVKIIIELGTVFKKQDNWREISKILVDSNIDYMKSNSGLLKQDFKDLYTYLKYAKNVFPMSLKASGGIREQWQIEDLIDLGIQRVGCSTTIEETT